MHDDVRIAALRAASKLALGVTFLGCSSTGDIEAEQPDDQTADDAYDLKGAKKQKPKADASAPAPCNDAGADAAAPSCSTLLASTFAAPAWADFHDYRWEKKPVPAYSAQVKTCCEQGLGVGDNANWDFSHRWECCNLLGGGTSTGEGAPIACTPWGPPVPPSMARRHARLFALEVA